MGDRKDEKNSDGEVTSLNQRKTENELRTERIEVA